MSLIVARHELRVLARERALLAAYVVFVAALGVGLGTGTAYLRQAADVARDVTTASDQHLDRMHGQLEALAAGRPPQGFVAATRASSIRFSLPTPVAPLTPLAIGQLDVLPASATVGLFSAPSTMFEVGSLANPSHLHIGRFDLSFAIVTLLPLVVVVLGYNLLSSERERGTLAFLLSAPVSLGRVIWTKAIVVWLLLTAPAIVVPLAWTMWVSPEARTLVVAFAGFSALVAVYCAFWVTVSSAVNLLGLRSVTNALLLGAAWLVMTVVAPATLGALATTLYPVPSRVQLIGDTRVAEVRANQQRDELLDRFYQDHPELTSTSASPQPNRTLAALAAFLDTQRAVTPLFDQFEQQIAAQHRLIDLVALASPAIAIREGLLGIAGTGREQFSVFRRDVLQFQGELRNYLLPRVASGQPVTLEDYAGAPRFAASRPPVGMPWRHLFSLLLPTLVLAAWIRRRCLSPVSV